MEQSNPILDAGVVDGHQSNQVQELKERIERLEKENARLQSLIQSEADVDDGENALTESEAKGVELPADTLSRDQIERYSRQLLLHGGFGVEGQLKLLSSSVLIVGAGGIGSSGEKKVPRVQGTSGI
jgi:hypothetical protein